MSFTITNSSELEYLSIFPSILPTTPTKLKLKPKIIKSSKKTKKIKRIIKSTELQPYTSSLVPNELEISSKSCKIFKNTSNSKFFSTEEPSPNKLKKLGRSFQIMAIFIIIFKIYSIIVKRITNISKNLTERDFRQVWNQLMLTFTELAKYLKDLSMKTKMIKSDSVKSLALLTESFYKSIKIYENMQKKKKSYGNVIWKALKFIPNFIKILINFDCIFPLEVLFPSSSLLIIAFLFKTAGIMRKARRLIRSSIKRWSLPLRRFIYLLKLFLVIFKMIGVIFAFFGMTELVLWIAIVQMAVYSIIFGLSLNSFRVNWLKKKQVKKNVQKNLGRCHFSESNSEHLEVKKEVKEENMLLSRRILENRMGKEEISI